MPIFPKDVDKVSIICYNLYHGVINVFSDMHAIISVIKNLNNEQQFKLRRFSF